MKLRTGVKNVIKSLIANGGAYECNVTRRSKRLDSAFVIIRNGKQYIVPQVRDEFGCVRPIRLQGERLVQDEDTVFTLDDPGIVKVEPVESLEALETIVE